MARGPGGHKADATGPHGRGAGPGGGTGTRKAYLEEDKKNPPLEKRVTGPGGGVPDKKGTKGYGMSAGPGGGKEEGMGEYFQEEFERLYDQYPSKRGTIDSYIKDYYLEATEKYRLTGTKRWDYVLGKVKANMKKETNDRDRLEKIAYSSDYKSLKKEYGSTVSKYPDVDVRKYHNEAVKKGYKGRQRRDYVSKKAKEKSQRTSKAA